MQPPDSTPPSPVSHPWSRQQTAAHLDAFEAVREQTSIRAFARAAGVPRSTLQDWIARKHLVDASPALRDFFESPDGLAFLHRLVGAAHLVFAQVGPCGIRLITTFLELSRLDRFVAASFGSQHEVSRQVEQAVGAFGDAERERLGPLMRPRSISVAQDETFHPETCLVAIEPVSNFILVERYSERRDAPAWGAAMKEALSGLPLEVVQATSDEAKGLLAHARQGLGAHHSPDLFHVQHEITKGTSGALASRTREAEAARAKAEAGLERITTARARFDDPERRRSAGRRPNFEKRLEEGARQVAEAKGALEAAQTRHDQMREAVRGLGTDYHPYDLETGRARSARALAEAIEQRFVRMDDVASEAGLGERVASHLDKAWRVVDAMVSTLEFVHTRVRLSIEALTLSPTLERGALEALVPAEYLERAASKAPTGDARRAIGVVSQRLRREWEGIVEAGDLLGPQREQVERVGIECAELFQRSSSCVEGRNAQLALRHHSLHRLSTAKLKALTVIHNFVLERADGTTAVERFFGTKPRDLFEWVLDHIDVPARPAKPRSRRRLEAVA